MIDWPSTSRHPIDSPVLAPQQPSQPTLMRAPAEAAMRYVAPHTDDSPDSPISNVAAGSDAGCRIPATTLSIGSSSSAGMLRAVLHARTNRPLLRVTTMPSGAPSPSRSASRTSSTSLAGQTTAGPAVNRGGSPLTLGEPSNEPERK